MAIDWAPLKRLIGLSAHPDALERTLKRSIIAFFGGDEKKLEQELAKNPEVIEAAVDKVLAKMPARAAKAAPVAPVAIAAPAEPAPANVTIIHQPARIPAALTVAAAPTPTAPALQPAPAAKPGTIRVKLAPATAEKFRMKQALAQGQTELQAIAAETLSTFPHRRSAARRPAAPEPAPEVGTRPIPSWLAHTPAGPVEGLDLSAIAAHSAASLKRRRN